MLNGQVVYFVTGLPVPLLWTQVRWPNQVVLTQSIMRCGLILINLLLWGILRLSGGNICRVARLLANESVSGMPITSQSLGNDLYGSE
jgi:hypothetical protein